MSDFDRSQPVRTVGTEDGSETGQEYSFVNNRRLQILAAKDKVQTVVFASFGTKNQRIIQVDYTAASIGTGAGFTARKTLAYVPDGNKYRLTTITWSLV